MTGSLGSRGIGGWRLISYSVTFRTFMFTVYSQRITDLFLVTEEIAFQRLDIQLAQKLIELAPAGPIGLGPPISKYRHSLAPRAR